MARQSGPHPPRREIGSPPTEPRWATVLRWTLGVLMLWAAVSKLANLTGFLGAIYAYDLPLPRGFLKLIAVILPWVELLCGLSLVSRVWTDSALAMTGGLMAVFILATGQAWARGLKISCGCFNLKIFGFTDEQGGLVQFLESPAFAFFRNLALLVIALQLLRLSLAELKRASDKPLAQ